MNKVIYFGEKIEGYNIPVLNEREIRAAAGLLFLLMFYSIFTVVFTDTFLLLKYSVIIFLADISVRVFINPKFSPFLIIGRFIVKNQVPEYVGAKQKKFAWIIGFILGIIMLIHLNILNGFSPITGLICLICLIFLFFETAFGICIGCKFYSLIYKEKAQYCPGEVCSVKERHEIQKINLTHIVILVSFIIFIILVVLLFNDYFILHPIDIFGLES